MYVLHLALLNVNDLITISTLLKLKRGGEKAYFNGEAISGEVTSGSEEIASGPHENELTPSTYCLLRAQEGILSIAFLYCLCNTRNLS